MPPPLWYIDAGCRGATAAAGLLAALGMGLGRTSASISFTLESNHPCTRVASIGYNQCGLKAPRCASPSCVGASADRDRTRVMYSRCESLSARARPAVALSSIHLVESGVL